MTVAKKVTLESVVKPLLESITPMVDIENLVMKKTIQDELKEEIVFGQLEARKAINEIGEKLDIIVDDKKLESIVKDEIEKVKSLSISYISYINLIDKTAKKHYQLTNDKVKKLFKNNWIGELPEKLNTEWQDSSKDRIPYKLICESEFGSSITAEQLIELVEVEFKDKAKAKTYSLKTIKNILEAKKVVEKFGQDDFLNKLFC